jgi:hypothetical protein
MAAGIVLGDWLESEVTTVNKAGAPNMATGLEQFSNLLTVTSVVSFGTLMLIGWIALQWLRW